MAYPLRHQPVKSLYLTYELLSTSFIRFPVWLVLSIPKTLRPRPSWSVKRCLLVRFIRHLGTVSNRTGIRLNSPNHLAIAEGPNFNGVWVDPVPEFITGELRTWATAACVSPVRIPGYWYHKHGSTISVAAPPMPGEKVFLALHGGAYMQLSAYPGDLTANIPRGLLEYCDTAHRVFCPEYRLSTALPYKPDNPFPAALLDAIAGYAYLVNTVGFSPSDIIVEGDSAGGNLALALTRYLIEYHNTPDLNIPHPPGALLLLSPWTDVGVSHNTPGSSAFAHYDSDIIAGSGGFDYAHDAFLGPHGMGAAALNRYISPASLDPAMVINFHGFPRTLIIAGGGETLVDQIRTLKVRMIKDLGEGDGVGDTHGKVRYYEAIDGVHDFLGFTWHEPERGETLKEISKWVAAA